ncbi:MAG: tRNA lysidine(34) synthetase TilS [Phycisphaerales bacterium]|nr:tRNA lysidine(34) synthetase TilS [Phycisphaerales bacterium]
MPRASATNRVQSAHAPCRIPLAARRHPFIAQLERGLKRCGLPGSHRELRLVIGCSGGADSVALLLGCLVLSARATRHAQRTRLVPIAVHVHHHLRPSADADAAFVEGVCQRFGIQFHVEHVQPATLKGNLSANSRRLRYQALGRIAHSVGARHVAVAHHADDQFETMLMALCRGAGLSGLAGMRWTRRLDSAVSLVRPLLGVPKTDCEDFCRTAGIQWRDDPSNLDATKKRARMRRDVLPVLHELWPNAAQRVQGASDLLRALNCRLKSELAQSFGPRTQHQWERKSLAALPSPLIAAGLRRAAVSLMPDSTDRLTQRQLSKAAAAVRSSDRRPRFFDWPAGMRLEITSKRVSLVRAVPGSQHDSIREED